jgi:hypothetical protein
MITGALHWWQWLFHRSGSGPTVDCPGARDELLRRARCAIRDGELELAEALVMEYGEPALRDAACLNALGLICEARGRWGDARRFWSRALRADPRFEPPRTNLRRYFELFQWGRTDCPVAFGDETALDLLLARRIHREC